MNKSGRKHRLHIGYTKIFLASIPTRTSIPTKTSLTSILSKTSLGSSRDEDLFFLLIFIFASLNVF